MDHDQHMQAHLTSLSSSDAVKTISLAPLVPPTSLVRTLPPAYTFSSAFYPFGGLFLLDMMQHQHRALQHRRGIRQIFARNVRADPVDATLRFAAKDAGRTSRLR
jgi:hypothetical protein